MGRIRFDGENCGVARSLEVLGDWWTLLIVRDAFFGVRRFADFQRNLGISRNVLTARLKHLVEHAILERVDVGEHGPRFEYQLTEKGEALLPVLTTLREWGDEWVFGRGNEPLVMRERATGDRLPPTQVRNHEGRVLSRRDIRAEPGPGAALTPRSSGVAAAIAKRRAARKIPAKSASRGSGEAPDESPGPR